MRSLLTRAFLLFSLLISAVTFAAQPESAQFKDGVHFRTLSSSKQNTNAPIEVKGIFWYGCPHCLRLEPSLDDWVKDLGKDVKFVRSPGVFSRDTIWENHARMYFALDSMGVSDKTHSGIFNEVQVRGNRLATPETMAEFLNEKYGIDEQKFKKAYASFGVQRQISQTMTNVRRYRLTGVPALVVAGKYVIEPGTAGSVENMLNVADYLIEKENSQRTGK